MIPRTATAAPAGGSRGGERRGFLRPPRFLADIVSELRKVVWPSREDTTYLTVVVIIVTIITGAILGGIDIGFGRLIDETLLRR